MDLIKLENNAAQNIVNTSKFICSYSVFVKSIGIHIPGALYRNLRDAMVHFKVMVDYSNSGDMEQVYKHYYNLDEHLLRGIKDSIIIFIRDVLFKLSLTKQSQYYNADVLEEDKSRIVEIEHLLSNILVEIRVMGLKLDEGEDSIFELFNNVKEQVCRANEILKNYSIVLF